MVNNCLLHNLDIDFLLNQKEVTDAKQNINKLSTGSIYFTIDLTETIRKSLFENLGLDLSNINSIPMRWIKGDTHPHIDRSRSSDSFSNTYLAYLTDSPGELIVDGTSFPISKGNAYVFSEGLSHETVGTGSEPRLLLGPMNENGISVGTLTIQASGETDTIYIKYIEDPSGIGTGIFYKINNGSYNGISFPTTIENTNTDYTLNVLFETDIVLNNQISYFICNTNNIQFGSTSLNSDGSRPIITIDGVANYAGLILNGYNTPSTGKNNIYVFNLEINAINGSELSSDGGWIGQVYFGKDATNNFIINCSSSGPIIDGGGGIIGGYSGSGSGSTLYITGCSSDGNTGVYSGGIIGFYAGFNGGQVICENCWSTGALGQYAGGIFGFYAGNNTGLAQAIKCYSSGAIGDEAGGIFGRDAGYDNGTAEANKCYSQGIIGTDAGGIFGSYAGSNGGTTTATNCYSSGGTTTPGNGIYGSNVVDDNPIRCYVANGNWSDSVANTFLIDGIPNPIVGTIWVASGGENYPYELNNMGYSPYTIENIVFQGVGGIPILNQAYNLSISSGGSSIAAIRPSYSYEILNKSGGDSGSYGTITMNDNTGIISTTSATKSGSYIITMRNTGSYNITSFSLTVTQNIIPDIIPNTPICFPAGTPVLTDQGEIAIEKIDTKTHTIRGQKIVAITESIPGDSYLVCIEKNSLSYSVPNRRTIISKDHKIMCHGKLVRAEYLIQYIPTIYRIPYNKEKLYNVLLKDYSTMSINNLIVETMNPHNVLAKIYAGNYTATEKNKMIKIINKLTIQERKKSVISRNMDMA
jgi:hypothetical protein